MQILGDNIIVVVLCVFKHMLNFLSLNTTDDSEQVQKALQA